MVITMKKKIRVMAMVLALCMSFAIGASAAGNMERISAYINYGIGIKFDGNTQKMYDANGNRVYPITYNGTTYLPVRAVSSMMGLAVNYDSKSNTVWLGDTNGQLEIDVINDMTPYSGSKYVIKNTPLSIMGSNTVDNYIHGRGYVFYNLEGNYTTLTFKAYMDGNDCANRTVAVMGDGTDLRRNYDVRQNMEPKTFTVDVTNIKSLSITSNDTYIYDVKLS